MVKASDLMIRAMDKARTREEILTWACGPVRPLRSHGCGSEPLLDWGQGWEMAGWSITFCPFCGVRL